MQVKSEGWKKKNKATWKRVGEIKPASVCRVPRNVSPKQIFATLWTKEIEENVVKLTNDNWQIHHPEFKPLKLQEFKDFLQVRASIQVERPRVLMSYWNRTARRISRDRFQEINNHLIYDLKLNEQFQAH